jgi:hypothetical protein
MFKNRVMRKKCRAEREEVAEVAEDCRKIPIEALRFLYSTNYFSGLRIQEQ